MQPDTLGKMAVDYGLGISLAVAIAACLGWVLKQMFKQQSVIMAQSEKREERLAEIVNTTLAKLQIDLAKHDDRAADGIDNINNSLKQIKDDIQRQGSYQREEHSKMIDLLNNLILETKTIRREGVSS